MFMSGSCEVISFQIFLMTDNNLARFLLTFLLSLPVATLFIKYITFTVYYVENRENNSNKSSVNLSLTGIIIEFTVFEIVNIKMAIVIHRSRYLSCDSLWQCFVSLWLSTDPSGSVTRSQHAVLLTVIWSVFSEKKWLHGNKILVN